MSDDWTIPKEDALDWSVPDNELVAEQDSSFVGELVRQVGLATRYGIKGLMSVPDLLATPIREGVNFIRPGTLSTGGEAIADALLLPEPKPGIESAVGDISEVVAGTGSSAKVSEKLAGKVIPALKPAMEWLASNPSMQLKAAVGAGTAGAVAKEAELGPGGTFAATIAGSVLFPMSVRGARSLVEPIVDVAATIGASGGNKWGIKRLATEAVKSGLDSQDNINAAKYAAYAATEYVPGAKPTMGEAVAEFNAKPPIAGPAKTTGGWIVRLEKDLTGARFVEDALTGNTKRVDTVLANAREALDVTTSKLREPVLDAVNKAGGISTTRLLTNLDGLGQKPEVMGDPAMARAVRIASRNTVMLDRDGKINSRAIYAARKSINKAVAKAAEATEGTATVRDLKKMGWITRQIQLAIDDSIEDAAKGTNKAGQWRAYLDKYSSGMKLIEAHADRAEFAAEMAKQVKPLGSSIVPGELPRPPSLLNRKMMLVNWGIRLLGADANTPVVKDLSRHLTDPKEFAKLLERPPKDPLRVALVEAMRRGAIASGIGSMSDTE